MASVQAQDRAERVSRFQRPADERSVGASEGDDQGDEAPAQEEEEPVESMERALYLRERADNVGEAARDFQNRLLERLLVEREQLVTTRRVEAIRLLVQFVREEPESAAEMPDALLRLAELRWEEARGNYLRAFAAWQAVPRENRGRQPEPSYRLALRIYDRIIRRHRDFERYDLVLYMKAYALVELGEADDALALYRRILAEFSESRFVPDAHMALGEAAFSGHFDYAMALQEYEQVLEYPSSGLYDVALFKSAWCLWRLNRTQEAATRFRRVLDLGGDRSRMSSSQRRRLRDLQNEALDYLIQVFTEDESNTAQDVFAFLEEIGGEQYAQRVLVRLADTYIGQSRYERGIQAYTLLLEMDPTSPNAPDYQQEVAAAHSGMEHEDDTIAALRLLAANYGSGTDWASQQGDRERIARAERLGERSIRIQAMAWHEEGQRHNQRAKLERAATLYGVYLTHYRDREEAYQIRFYRAEILFHRLERFSQAGNEYLATARQNPTGPLSRDALYNAIGAFERVREEELRNCVRGDATASTPAPPEGSDEPVAAGDEAPAGGAAARAVCGESDNDRKFSDAIGLYVELFPNDPDLPEILFRQGRLYFDRGVFDPAVRLWGQLIHRYPESRFAEPAGELILDSFNRARDYGNIETWARRLKDAPAFQSGEKQRRLDGLILAAVFKLGEQLADRDQHADAADAYFRAAEEFPNDPRARQAYFNAGVERQRDGDLSGAMAAYDRLIERYPGSAEGARGCWAAAQMYESIAQFSDAARYYETYGERFPEASKVSEALYNAVLLRVTAGDNAAGVQDGNRFLRRFSQHPDADEVYFFMARAHQAAEDWNDAAQVYRRFIRRTRNQDRKVEATTRLGQVLLRAGQVRAADQALDDAVRGGRRRGARLSTGLYYAAQARYMQGDQVLAEYERVQIAGSMDGLRARLQRKSELLRAAAVIYADVVEFRVAEWVAAALFQIGRSYELFAEGLREAPIPEGLNEEEEQVYRDQLSMFIIPMEEQALQAYEGGYQKALELRIFNRWTQRLRDGLTRLNDVQYPPLREMGARIIEGTPLPPPEPLDGLRRDSEEPEGGSGARDRSPREERPPEDRPPPSDGEPGGAP